MSKSYFFFHGTAFSGDEKEKHITCGEDFRVDGGSKEDHDKMVDITSEFSKEVKDKKPENIHHAADILGKVIKKVGIKPPSR